MNYLMSLRSAIKAFFFYAVVNNKTFNQAERHQWSCMENEWEKEKEKILNSLLGAGQESLDFAVETEVREHVCY